MTLEMLPGAATVLCSTDSGLCAPARRAVLLRDVLDIELLEKMIASGYVNSGAHPLDETYRILCYSTRAQVEGKWNSATRTARGLIVRLGAAGLQDAVVLERPWAKFFTVKQLEGAWHLGDDESDEAVDDNFEALDFDAPAAVYDKLDGSLGVLYRDPHGDPALATKGSFASEQAVAYTAMLRNDETMLQAAEELLESDNTALFELVGPENRIVLAYSEAAVVLLGAVERATGADVIPELLTSWVDAGLPTVENMSKTLGISTLREALQAPEREAREGFVVTVGGSSPMKLKIKQDDYTRLHRLVTLFSPREARTLVRELSATVGDLMALAEHRNVEAFPELKAVLEIEGFKSTDELYEIIRKTRVEYFEGLLLPRADALVEAQATIAALPEAYFTQPDPRKFFAARVGELQGEAPLLFRFFAARLQGETLADRSASSDLRKAAKDA